MGSPPDEKERSAAEGPPGELPLCLPIQGPTHHRTDVLGFRLARTLR
jgi:hypothetical protein